MKRLSSLILPILLASCERSGPISDTAVAAPQDTPLPHQTIPSPSSPQATTKPGAAAPDHQKQSLKYGDRISSGRFLSVSFLKGNQTIRELHSEPDDSGAFEAEEPPRMSPDGRFVYITQIESAIMETPQGAKKHEVAYCNLVKMNNGCIVARETGEFCGGHFTQNGKWDNPIYPNFDMAAAAPKASDYASRNRRPTDSPEGTLDNLLACDPINSGNADAYRSIESKGTFDLTVEQRQALDSKLNHLVK